METVQTHSLCIILLFWLEMQGFVLYKVATDITLHPIRLNIIFWGSLIENVYFYLDGKDDGKTLPSLIENIHSNKRRWVLNADAKFSLHIIYNMRISCEVELKKCQCNGSD